MTNFKILSKKKKCTATKNSKKERVKSQHKVPRPSSESNRKDRGPSQLRVNRAQRPPGGMHMFGNIIPDILKDHLVGGIWPNITKVTLFSSTGHRPASLCHGPLSVVRPSMR